MKCKCGCEFDPVANRLQHRVVCGDARVAGKVGAGCADVVISSPPYWNQRDYSQWDTFDAYMSDMQMVWDRCMETLRPGGILFWNCGDDSPNHRHISAHHSLAIESTGFVYIDAIVWKKPGVTGIRMAHQITHNKYYPGFAFELITVFQKPGGDFPVFDSGSDVPVSNVWELRTEGTLSDVHSAPFPPELPATALQCYSVRGGVAHDPFLGSGTTMVAAEQLGRECCGIEIAPQYVAVVLQRMTDMGCQPRLSEDNGEA